MSTFPATNTLPQNGLITVRWLLDEASGSAIDSVGNNDLANTGVGAGAGLVVANANFDNSRDFERTEIDRFIRGDTADLSPTGDLTFSMWFNSESTPAGGEEQIMIFKRDGGIQNSYALWYRESGGNVQFRFLNDDDGAGPDTDVTWNYTLPISTWVHIVITYDASAGSAVLYADGVSQGTRTGLKTSIFDGTSDFTLGYEYDGLMNDFILWKGAALTSSEVSDLYDDYTEAAAPPAVKVVSTLSLMGV